MRTILFILRKEFLQLKRNKAMLPIILVLPVLQLFILVSAATLEIKNIGMTVCDYDMSSTSRGLISKFEASPFFELKQFRLNEAGALQDIEDDKTQMALIIPHDFEKNLKRENHVSVQVLINAINGTVAGIGSAYVQQIVMQFNKEQMAGLQANGLIKSIENIPAFWYNPDMNYKVFMVPALLVILVTIIGMMFAAMNIVREKEMGTIEQINVTPITKIQFVVGKLLPYWLIALFMLAFGLVAGKLMFHIPIEGSLRWLFLVAAVYLLVMQGFGLMISNVANTQQQAMFVSFFFLIVFIMMSGIFTPVESMPSWAQTLNQINPIAYFMSLIRMILLKGSSIGDFISVFVRLCVYAIAVLTLAVVQYRKRA